MEQPASAPPPDGSFGALVRPYPAGFKVTHRALAQFGTRGKLFLR